jgi:hypothetical protein
MIARALDAGFSEHLMKPASAHKIVASVEGFLRPA